MHPKPTSELQVAKSELGITNTGLWFCSKGARCQTNKRLKFACGAHRSLVWNLEAVRGVLLVGLGSDHLSVMLFRLLTHPGTLSLSLSRSLSLLSLSLCVPVQEDLAAAEYWWNAPLFSRYDEAQLLNAPSRWPTIQTIYCLHNTIVVHTTSNKGRNG